MIKDNFVHIKDLTLQQIHNYANLVWSNPHLTPDKKYDRIFSEHVSQRVFREIHLDYCDPDTTYEEDVDAFMRAFNAKMRELENVSEF